MFCGFDSHSRYLFNILDCGVETKGGSGLCVKCGHKKQRRLTERPSYDILMKDIEETNYCAVGRKYGVSDNAIRKWVKSYEQEMNDESKGLI